MSTYVVYKKAAFEPANEVYFKYSLEEAIAFHQLKEVETDSDWAIAQEIPTDSRWFKLFVWLTKYFD